MDKIPIITKIKLLGYFWVAIGSLLIANLIYWNIYEFLPFPMWLIYTIDFGASSIGVFYVIKILSGHRRRCKTYLKLYNRYAERRKNNEKIKTYELYVLRQTLCGSVVVKQLCKDFDIVL